MTNGASGGLMLAAAACLAGLDPARMERLPDTRGLPNEMIIARSHRSGYDHALRAVGARLVEVGLPDPLPWEIEAAISPRTAAIAFSAGFSRLDLARRSASWRTVTACRSSWTRPRNCPPPRTSAPSSRPGPTWSPSRAARRSAGRNAGNPLRSQGPDRRRGPPALGHGRALGPLRPAAALIDRDRLAGVPNHGIGRGCKVGKEEIVGLVTALELYVRQDHEAQMREWEAWARPSRTASQAWPASRSRRSPRLQRNSLRSADLAGPRSRPQGLAVAQALKDGRSLRPPRRERCPPRAAGDQSRESHRRRGRGDRRTAAKGLRFAVRHGLCGRGRIAAHAVGRSGITATRSGT